MPSKMRKNLDIRVRKSLRPKIHHNKRRVKESLTLKIKDMPRITNLKTTSPSNMQRS
jgi:hypothetical protein